MQSDGAVSQKWTELFFSLTIMYFFHVSGFLWVEKSLNPRAEHNTTKGICISCQFVFQSLLPHIMCHFPVRYINPLYFIPFLIFLMECHFEYRTVRVFFSSQDSSMALGRTVSISWAATTKKSFDKWCMLYQRSIYHPHFKLLHYQHSNPYWHNNRCGLWFIFFLYI